MVSRLLARSSARFYLAHPWQLALAIAGISLGVAVYVGVDLANDSARRAFELSSSALTGGTTHRLLPLGGRLAENVYVDLVTSGGVTTAAPVIEAEVQLADRPERLPLLGIDPLEEAAFRSFSGLVPARSSDLEELIAEPDTVLVPEFLAEELGTAPGMPLKLLVHGRPHTVRVIGTVQSIAADAQAPPILADIATAQELLDEPGVIDRIDLRLTDEQARALAAGPPRGTALVPARGRSDAFAELTRAFRTNLTALGLLALVVGMFLIYATMSFAIVQRRTTMGVLRALGVGGEWLLSSVLLEAACVGAVATAIGLALGHILAIGLVDLVLRTIGDLYFASAVAARAASPLIYVKGAALGVCATLAAALAPAFEASRTAPQAVMRRADLERAARRRARLAALLAVPVVGGALALIAAGTRDLYTAFAGLFCVLAAGALLTPAATMVLMKVCERPAERVFRLPGLLAVRGVTASLSRTGVATAALAVAVATVIGIGLMIGSFRASLVDWLETTLTADVYVTFTAGQDGVALTDANLEAIAALPDVSGISLSRAVRVPTEQGELALRAARPGPRGWGLAITGADPDEALDELGAGEGVVLSEPFAYRRGLGIGDALVLPTAEGPERLEVLGVFHDYNTAGGSAVMSLGLYRRLWHDNRLTGLGLDTRHAPDESFDEVELAAGLRAALPAGTEFRLRSTRAIERISLQVFDRTFEITEVLRILAALVAFLGVLSALLSIELERARELAVLRSIGFAPRQLSALLLTQTGLLGAAAGVAALPLGVALAALLVYVINRRSFGWSMTLSIEPEAMLWGLALAIGAALLAGVYPALRSSRVDLAGALREE